MPQQQQKQHNGQKKKKKGRAPAHQNKFAYKHNPKSKTTEKILSSPITHVCRRCYEKLEWRKQYRKYKPRTQPGTCNGCKKRNVKAAYHTMCESCTRNSPKAKELIEIELELMKRKIGAKRRKRNNVPAATSDSEIIVSDSNIIDNDDDYDEEEEEEEEEEEILMMEELPKLRACAICVKEMALPDPDDDDDGINNELAMATGRLKLRELKTLERQLEREAEAAKKSKGDLDHNDDDEEGHNNIENNDDGHAHGHEEADNKSAADNNDQQDLGGGGDPFLQAVGGADNLLTGEAYRAKLMMQSSAQATK